MRRCACLVLGAVGARASTLRRPATSLARTAVVLLALGPLPGRASGDGGAEAAGKLPAETSEFDLWTAGEPEEAIPEFHDVKDAACSYFLDPISWPGVRSQLQDIVFRGVPIDHELARTIVKIHKDEERCEVGLAATGLLILPLLYKDPAKQIANLDGDQDLFTLGIPFVDILRSGFPLFALVNQLGGDLGREDMFDEAAHLITALGLASPDPAPLSVIARYMLALGARPPETVDPFERASVFLVAAWRTVVDSGDCDDAVDLLYRAEELLKADESIPFSTKVRTAWPVWHVLQAVERAWPPGSYTLPAPPPTG